MVSCNIVWAWTLCRWKRPWTPNLPNPELTAFSCLSTLVHWQTRSTERWALVSTVLPGPQLWLILPTHILISSICVLGGKPDDITVLLSIVAEYTDWLATLATPAFPCHPSFPCHVCWSCWQDHISLPLISVANAGCLALVWDPLRSLLRTTIVIH